jgi:hypothetical protein
MAYRLRETPMKRTYSQIDMDERRKIVRWRVADRGFVEGRRRPDDAGVGGACSGLKRAPARRLLERIRTNGAGSIRHKAITA